LAFCEAIHWGHYWGQIASEPDMPQPRTHYRKTHIETHAGGFRYKRRVPRDLHAVIGKVLWVSWLGTRREEAALKGAALGLEHSNLIDGLRRLRDHDPAAYATISANGLTAWQGRAKAAEMGARFVEHVANTGIGLGFGPDDPSTVQADDLMTGARAQETLKELRTEIAEARRIERVMGGKPDDDGALFELCDLWERVRNPRSAKVREKTRLYVRRFIAHAGDLAPRDVTRDHAISFRDKLAETGTESNARQHLDKLRTLFNVAMSEGVVSVNPFHKVQPRRDQKKFTDGKQPFTPQQARIIFKALDGEDDDFAWAMKLLAYHGARGGEVCQLRVDDVATVNGVPVLRIHDQHGSVKNAASVRDVPIHPRCMGIVAYAKRVAAKYGTDAWLFQSFKDHKQGRAHRFQDRGSRFLRKKVGIADERLTVHSWRHTFRTLARNVEMPLPVSHAIMGHAEGGEHGKYGDRPAIKLCARWIAKVDPLKG
jgi:integrase